MRTLLIDIERTPHLVHRWDLFDSGPVSLNQLIEPGGLLCFAAKWLDEKGPPMFFRDPSSMVFDLQELLDMADVLVHYNGKKFDVPHINKEIVMVGLPVPSPFTQIDLYRVVRRHFNFASHKLAHVAEELGIGGKVEHEGHMLWRKCMAEDPAAWRKMERYNKQDVMLLQKLYKRVLPWINDHPSKTLMDGSEGCPTCGGRVQSRGWAYTTSSRYPRFQCQKCGRWLRGTRRDKGDGMRGVAA